MTGPATHAGYAPSRAIGHLATHNHRPAPAWPAHRTVVETCAALATHPTGCGTGLQAVHDACVALRSAVPVEADPCSAAVPWDRGSAVPDLGVRAEGGEP